MPKRFVASRLMREKKLPDDLVHQIEELEKELNSLTQQRETFENKAQQWAKKRDTIHKQIKDLRLEIVDSRQRRDTINEKVKALKTQRDQTRTTIKEKINEAKNKREKLRLLRAKRPRQDAEKIRLQKEEIEWQIQTTPLTLQEEKPLVEKANQLGIFLEIFRQITNLEEEISDLQNKIDTMNEEAKVLHSRISELALASQEQHERMIEGLNKVKTLQPEADRNHQSFISEKNDSKGIHKRLLEIKKRIKTLKANLTEDENKKRRQLQEETRKRIKAEASKKLKQGKKLSLEEFKLLTNEHPE
ncbi:MAG: hypothetical protein JSV05_00010 [Candidatus Bathyarchaeota archaeon]|nr:MAG: hypothetical protein JSV05_00010 [Candidatus Bathyarchaeota archaeon]